MGVEERGAGSAAGVSSGLVTEPTVPDAGPAGPRAGVAGLDPVGLPAEFRVGDFFAVRLVADFVVAVRLVAVDVVAVGVVAEPSAVAACFCEEVFLAVGFAAADFVA